MNVDVKEIEYGSKEYQLELELRSKVLREPLGLQFTAEELALDTKDIHLGAFVLDKLVGCLILSPRPESRMKMRQVAVDPPAQGLGVGKKLVECSEERSIQLGFSILELNARETAIPFYIRLGYELFDAPFEEVSIPHRKMRKVLSRDRLG